MIAIVVLAFSSIAVVIFSEVVANPPHTPHTDLQESIDPANNRLYIFHMGGESIDLKDVNIILVNSIDTNESEEYNVSSNNFSSSATNNILMLGDHIRINPAKISLSTNDTIMFFVHTPSQQAIQRVLLHGNK
jgi:hypothetical protein